MNTKNFLFNEKKVTVTQISEKVFEIFSFENIQNLKENLVYFDIINFCQIGSFTKCLIKEKNVSILDIFEENFDFIKDVDPIAKEGAFKMMLHYKVEEEYLDARKKFSLIENSKYYFFHSDLKIKIKEGTEGLNYRIKSKFKGYGFLKNFTETGDGYILEEYDRYDDEIKKYFMVRESDDYSEYKNLKIFRWMSCFIKRHDLKFEEQLDFELNQRLERAGEVGYYCEHDIDYLDFIRNSEIQSSSNGICLVYGSKSIHSIYAQDVYSLRNKKGKLYPTRAEHTFIGTKEHNGHKNTEEDFYDYIQSAGWSHSEGFIKEGELPEAIIVKRNRKLLTQLFSFLKENNLNIKVWVERDFQFFRR